MVDKTYLDKMVLVVIVGPSGFDWNDDGDGGYGDS